ncbi:hypothetical protein [Magnetospirillum sp. SS-4]|uniref:hypothetical protein n=1 Tax=Magnetospirillum sp. SS-4 TaxID=2681465 RepID=UPI0013801E9A|nr:hypothetical protein [Magnetospirillum sp. SS-4]CAA7612728.1 conserved hypothetical protein [Magnetospirillum sp. SS-4]
MTSTERDQGDASVEAFYRRIDALLKAGADQQALEIAEEALQDPGLCRDASCAMAVIYYRAGALGYAIRLLAAQMDQPDHPADLSEVLAVMYSQAGCLSDALYYAKLATTEAREGRLLDMLGPKFPKFSDAFSHIRPKPLLSNGIALLAAGNLDQALFSVEQHLSLLPDDVEALDAHAQIKIQMGCVAEAVGMLRSIATLIGPSATLLSRLGGCLIQTGQFHEGLACHQEAVARAPTSLPILGAAIADLRYFGRAEAQASGLIDAWTAQVAASAPRTVRPAPKYAGAQPVRVCYLCSALESEDARAMMGAVARSHDRSRVSVVGFGRGEIDHPANEWARGSFDVWRDVSSLDVTTLGALIRGEGIHVVIDADGSLAPARRGLFMRNTAPLQLAWLNQPVAGRIPGNYLALVPCASEAGEGELALPAGRYFLGDAGGRHPSTGPGPAAAAGVVAFGAELTRAELNPRLAMVWGRILQAVPKSMLVLRDSGMFSEPANVEALISLFGNAGVAHRIDVVKNVGRAEFAASIDVALLPFPAGNVLAYGEFLRHGVPAVAMTGCDAGADLGAFLAAAGLGDALVAADPDAYVALATGLAADIGALEALRGRLPAAIAQVPAATAKGFARMIEDTAIAALERSQA